MALNNFESEYQLTMGQLDNWTIGQLDNWTIGGIITKNVMFV
jgi:hypothetical protein